MLKKIIVSVLSAIVVTAVGVGAYQMIVTPSAQAEAQAAPVATQAVIEPGSGPAWAGNNNGQIQDQGQGWRSQNNQAIGQAAGQPGNGSTWAQGNSPRGGRGNGRQARANTSAGTGSGIPNPQNGFQESVTLHGTVSSYAPPTFILVTDEGGQVTAQLGNLNYLSTLGLNLQEGDTVVVTGYYEVSGALAIEQLTLDSSGQTFVLRDDLGRPLWGGGPNR